jgi:hypothetical protein
MVASRCAATAAAKLSAPIVLGRGSVVTGSDACGERETRKLRGKFRKVVLSATVAILAFPVGAAPASAACVKTVEKVVNTPHIAAKGARMVWKGRTLVATDTGAQGFAAQVLWVGTNGISHSQVWVEVGATDGWQGQNITTFYTASSDSTGARSEARISAFPVQLGTTYTFTIEPSATAGFYSAKVSNGSLTSSSGWNNHSPGVRDYAGGLESTCGTSRIDNTYISANQFRRTDNGVWTNPTVGTKTNTGLPGTVDWCVQPRTFHYALNNQILYNCS